MANSQVQQHYEMLQGQRQQKSADYDILKLQGAATTDGYLQPAGEIDEYIKIKPVTPVLESGPGELKLAAVTLAPETEPTTYQDLLKDRGTNKCLTNRLYGMSGVLILSLMVNIIMVIIITLQQTSCVCKFIHYYIIIY